MIKESKTKYTAAQTECLSNLNICLSLCEHHTLSIFLAASISNSLAKRCKLSSNFNFNQAFFECLQVIDRLVVRIQVGYV